MRDITWDQLSEWFMYIDQEPIGEERADLRAGALATVVLNTQIDTKAIGGSLTPLDYIAGWNDDHVYIMGPKPKGVENESQTQASKGQLDLNDPVGWENFTTGLIKSVGGLRKRKEE